MNHLVASLWQGAIIAVITTLAVRVVPPAAASKRHFIWWVALILTLALPFIDGFAWSAGRPLISAPVEAVETRGFTLPMPPAWFIVGAVMFWAAIALAHFCRLALGVRALRQLVTTSSPLDGDRVARLTRFQAARTSGRFAELRVSKEIAGACAVGFSRPTIVVSAELASALNDEALESIVLHEYAHLHRYDEWSSLAQRVVLAVARWHPAVLWISRHIDVEREIACDQRVVAGSCAPLSYARSLAEAAEFIANARGAAPVLAPGSSTATPILRLRVERLLGLTPVRYRSLAAGATASVAAVVVAAAISLSQVPLLVSFTARTAQAVQPAILASAAFLTNIPHGLPLASAGRSTDLAASSEISVVPAQPELVAFPRQTLVGIQASASDPVTSEDPTGPDVTVPVVTARHLGATSIPFLARVPAIDSTAAADEADLEWSALGRGPAAAGTAVARAGTATGVAASRAGTSVSRFFKNGGLAIARSF